MDLALILLLLSLIVAAVGWALLTLVKKIDEASTHTERKSDDKRA